MVMFLRTAITTFVCLLSLISLVFLARLYRRDNVSSSAWVVPSFSAPHAQPCPDTLDWLLPLDLTYPIKYARRDIVIESNPQAKRLSVTKLPASLFPDFQSVDLTDGTHVQLKDCQDPLVLHVPAPKGPVDASHILFGISTTLDRLNDSIPSLLRWLPHTNAKLFVIAIKDDDVPEDSKDRYHPADAKEMSELQSHMRNLGLDVTIVHPLSKHDWFSQRYFSLVRVMYEHRESSTQWISLIDDDTFFLSMPALVEMLSTFDPGEQFYVGALSEDWWSVARYGMMGFGGAGVFLSIPLAEIVNAKYEDCHERSHTSAGDIRLRECISWYTRTKLTNILDLHQIDIHKDLSGIYESGRLHLSLHHWKGGGTDGKGYPLHMMHLVADICGDCFLQRWQFGNEMLLTNGFSIATYPHGVKTLDLEMMEETWDHPTVVQDSVNTNGVDHSLGPTRPKLTLGEDKIQYRLLDSRVVNGTVRQTYFSAGVDGDHDTILELVWMKPLEHSTEPPRH